MDTTPTRSFKVKRHIHYRLERKILHLDRRKLSQTKIQMSRIVSLIFFAECAIFIILSIPLHSKLLRPRVHDFFRKLLECKLMKVCRVQLNIFELISAFCTVALGLQTSSDQVLPFAACIMMNWCIYAYWSLRCKYENVRDSALSKNTNPAAEKSIS